MRLNFKSKKRKQSSLLSHFITEFSKEYDMTTAETTDYVTTGLQGLNALANFLITKGWNVEPYYLDPNKLLLQDVKDDFNRISRTSFSYGLIIPDNDPKLVEFKLKN